MSAEPLAGLRLRRLSGVGELAELAERWDALVEKAASPNVFATTAWLLAWWRAFGAGRDPWLLVVEEPDLGWVGVAPLMLVRHRTGPVALRAVELIGVDVPACADHVEPVCVPGWEAAVGRAVAAHLVDGSARWDVARWVGVPEEAASVTALVEALGASGRRVTRAPAMPCPYLAFDATWGPHDRHLHRKFRDLSKYLAAVERRGGRFRLVGAPAELGRALADLRRLSLLRVRSKGETPGLVDDRAFAFVSEVCARFLERGWLRLHVLEVDGEVVGANLNFAYGGKVYGYMSGLDPAWTRHGIGTVLMRQAVRSAFEEGCREYDFLRGAEEYKYRWTSTERRAVSVHAVNHRPRYLAFAAGRVTAGACRRWSAALSRGLRRARPAAVAARDGQAGA